MTSELLKTINCPRDLRRLKVEELPALAKEIREFIVDTVSRTPGHLASNLGVVELTIALHYAFEFLTDKLIWDVGHQCYVHKLLTGRREGFSTLRQYKGLSGFPSKKESEYDPFICGHGGHAISTALGLSCADKIKDVDRKIVAVVGDASIGEGMSFEALNHAGDLKRNMIVILNDNEMGISSTVGAFSKYLNKIRTTPLFSDFKKEVHHLLKSFPIVGKRMDHTLEHITEILKREITPGQIFVDLGFNYFGPIDGHDIKTLIEILNDIKPLNGPLLLHVITEKGRGFEPASSNPARYHSAGKFQMRNGKVVEHPKDPKKISYTRVFSETLIDLASSNKEIVAITAAMPEGTGLDAFGKVYPERYFDVGMCEQHAIGLANGIISAGLKPVAAIYSTFLQRAYDQVFHDICVQGHSMVLALDRAGIVGSDGPTHNGVFDIAYLRHLPGMVLMAPKDGSELKAMLRKAVSVDSPVAIRYPKDDVPDEDLGKVSDNIEIGKGEIVREGPDGAIIAYGAMVQTSLKCAHMLAEQDIEITVVNARFAKPLDEALILKIVSTNQVVLTVEDHTLVDGFGTAVLELINNKGEDTSNIHRLGIPDRFMEHGSRDIILKSVGIDAEGICASFLSCWNKLASSDINDKADCKQTLV